MVFDIGRSFESKRQNMKKVTLLLFLFTFTLLSAQSNRNVEKGLFKINAFLPGVSYELGVGKNSSFNFDAIVGFALNGGSDRDTNFGLYPGIGVEFRYYYNMERRLSKGKHISGNSGNYISALNQWQLGSPLIGDLQYSSDYYYNAAIVYGIQRTYKSGFYFSLAFGPAVFRDDFDVDSGLLIDVKLGWVLRKKR